MITAVDTNILLDTLAPNQRYADASKRALADAALAGALVISEPVYAELAVQFLNEADLRRFLVATGVRLEPSGLEALHRAGQAWGEYTRRRPPSLACPRCGNTQLVRCDRCGANLQPRQHVVADFIIGAHALVHADQLLSRDRGFYTTYFPDLTVG